MTDIKIAPPRQLTHQLGSHLPFPFLTQRFTKEAKSWEDVWKILYDHYGVLPTQVSFLQYASLKKQDDENPLTFYERLCHHYRSHLAPAGAEANGIRNADPDTMNITAYNHVALDWLKALDLVESVQTEFSNELKGGIQLAALVPRIAHQTETLKRRQGLSQVQHISDGDGLQLQGAAGEPPQQQQVMYLGGSTRGGNWHHRGQRGSGYRGGRGGPSRGGQGRGSFNAGGQGRGSFNTGGRGGAYSQGAGYCPNCRYLGQELRLSVNFNHSPADCPRRTSRQATTNMIADANQEDTEEANEYGEQDQYDGAGNFDMYNYQDEVSQINSILLPQVTKPPPTVSSKQVLAPTTMPSPATPQPTFNNNVQPSFIESSQPSFIESTTTPPCSSPTNILSTSLNLGKSWTEEITAKIRRLEDKHINI